VQKEIRHTWQFNQSPQEVWDYLTKPELLGKWLMKTDFQPIVGHKFVFTHPPDHVTYCEVVEIQLHVRLSYSWQYPSAKDKKRLDSMVVWTLTPNEAGTELQLVHTGFTLLEDFVGHNNGWEKVSPLLVELINNPVPHDSKTA
jgi:uncharacterized protein YndB with AHSA1/START domain